MIRSEMCVAAWHGFPIKNSTLLSMRYTNRTRGTKTGQERTEGSEWKFPLLSSVNSSSLFPSSSNVQVYSFSLPHFVPWSDTTFCTLTHSLSPSLPLFMSHIKAKGFSCVNSCFPFTYNQRVSLPPLSHSISSSLSLSVFLSFSQFFLSPHSCFPLPLTLFLHSSLVSIPYHSLVKSIKNERRERGELLTTLTV